MIWNEFYLHFFPFFWSNNSTVNELSISYSNFCRNHKNEFE